MDGGSTIIFAKSKKDMEGLLVKNIELIGEKADGATYRFPASSMTEGIVGYRKAKSISGRHYHKGLSATKNPEKLLLLSGSMILRGINIKTGEKCEEVVNAPSEVHINPNIWHEVEALSDIVFTELNSLDEHIADTFYDFEVA